MLRDAEILVLECQWGPQRYFGIWGEGLFLLRELWSTGNYFRGAEQQTHSFRDLGSPAIE